MRNDTEPTLPESRCDFCDGNPFVKGFRFPYLKESQLGFCSEPCAENYADNAIEEARLLLQEASRGF